MGLITEYPVWFIIFCLLLGALYAAVLYYREKRSEIPTLLKPFLAVLRFLSISLISFLLLGPLLKTNMTSKEKPVVIIASDNSSSLIQNDDSSAYQTSFPEDLQQAADNLGSQYEVKTYIFGEKLKQIESDQSLGDALNYSDRYTDISQMMKEIRNLYMNRNVGALVMASDGIYNAGINPVYLAGNLDYPVYSVAMGDTGIRKDAILAKVYFNRLAYLNNQFPVEVVVNAYKASGQSCLLTISSKGKVLDSKTVKFENDAATSRHVFLLEASETGIQRYHLSLRPLEGESNTLNNSRDVYIEVLDSKNRILILSQSPHPDVTAIKEAIRSNLNYEVEDHLATNFNAPLDPFNLVILHQLPAVNNSYNKLFNSLKEKGIPLLIIVGSQSGLERFNNWQAGLTIKRKRRILEEALPDLNSAFTQFLLSDESRNKINSFPPLLVPFANYNVSNAANIFMKQRIGTVKTNKPLILFTENQNHRIGVITGEGIWRWRLADFSMNNNHFVFNELINKIIQYLSVRDDKSRFRIYHQTAFRENERILFEAEIYNESYELVNEPEIEIIVSDSEGNQFPFIFSRKGKSYVLDAGMFSAGSYTFMARSSLGIEKFTNRGAFSVSAINLENLNTVADHNVLFKLSQSTNGKVFYPDQLDLLTDELQNRDDIKTLIYSQKRYNELINIPLLAAIIILLLSIEWFLRKRNGSY